MKTIPELIQAYKTHISHSQLAEEKYKWELLAQFKGRPDVNAEDFTKEIESLNFMNLLYHLSFAVLKDMARAYPEDLRECFKRLFDESKSLQDRLDAFKEETLVIYRRLNPDKSHHQDGRSMSAYLTYRYPEKYTFFKAAFYKKFCVLMQVEPEKSGLRVPHYYQLLDQFIQEYVNPDAELTSMVQSMLPEHVDKQNIRLLAQDILYTMLDKKGDLKIQSNTPRNSGIKYWLYSPGDGAEKWEEFYSEGIMAIKWDELGDLTLFNSKAEIVDKLKLIDSIEGSRKNDATANDEFCNVMKKGDVVIVKSGKRSLIGIGEVLSDYRFDVKRLNFKSTRKVNWIKKGSWTADFDLVTKMLTDITRYKSDYDEYETYAEELIAIMESKELNKSMEPINQIFYGPPGTGKTYNTINQALKLLGENTNKLNRQDLKSLYERKVEEGQIIFTTFHQSMSYEDFVEGIKPVVPENQDGSVIYKVEDGIFKKLCKRVLNAEKVIAENQQSFTSFDRLYDAFLIKLNEVLHEVEEGEYYFLPSRRSNVKVLKVENDTILTCGESANSNETVTRDKLRRIYDTFQTPEDIKSIVKELRAVGTDIGWTTNYYAVFKALKDFEGGSIPKESSIEKKQFVIIIDEINRGNVSQIFGELITLMEPNKRLGCSEQLKIQLPYSKEWFGVPSNIHFIGTMNTADRSVEALDTALRRRFSFHECMPDPLVLKDKLIGAFNLSELLTKINSRIEALIDRDHTIGHAYLIGVNNMEDLRLAFKDKIIPLLQEYFYGDYGKIGLVLGEGFVRSKSVSHDVFSSFQYEGRESLVQESYELIPFDTLDFETALSKL